VPVLLQRLDHDAGAVNPVPSHGLSWACRRWRLPSRGAEGTKWCCQTPVVPRDKDRGTRQALAKASGIEAASVHRYGTKHTADGWHHIRPVDIAPEQAVRACGAFRAMDVTSAPTQRIVFGSWPSSPTSVISWHFAARMGVEVCCGATPRAARGSGGRVAWRGPRCHRRVDQCCAPWLARQT